ncbi:hypothetical protein FHT77_003415 [Rhizobium sp. BK181]|nr:hypothetical protein [Rhizobium sp. BK181]
MLIQVRGLQEAVKNHGPFGGIYGYSFAATSLDIRHNQRGPARRRRARLIVTDERTAAGLLKQGDHSRKHRSCADPRTKCGSLSCDCPYHRKHGDWRRRRCAQQIDRASLLQPVDDLSSHRSASPSDPKTSIAFARILANLHARPRFSRLSSCGGASLRGCLTARQGEDRVRRGRCETFAAESSLPQRSLTTFCRAP